MAGEWLVHATPGKEIRYPLYRRLGGGVGSVWTGAENLAPPPNGIRSPDRPARSKSLYRLSYPGLHPISICICKTSVNIVRRNMQGVAAFVAYNCLGYLVTVQ